MMVEVKDGYTVTEVAKLKGVHRNAVHTAIEAGKLETETTAGGTQRLITRASVERWHPTPGRPGRKPQE